MRKYENFSFYPALCCFTLASTLSWALPQDVQVTSGQAEVSQPNSKKMVIKASDKAVINYSTFDIGKMETVQFDQPNSDAVVLNRVEEGKESHILGALQSNGKVFLVNPNGIYFGPHSKVDIGSIIASTLDITDDNFVAGNYLFTLSDKQGAIVNRGVIRASEEGVVAFVSPFVDNSGVVEAPAGSVAFGVGKTVLIDFVGDGLISFVVDGELAKGNIAQSGRVVASNVRLQMSTVDKMLQQVVNMEGRSEGVAFAMHNGEISIMDSSSIHADELIVSTGSGARTSLDGEVNLSKKDGKATFSGETLSLKNIDMSSGAGSGKIMFLATGDDGTITVEEKAQIIAPQDCSVQFSTENNQPVRLLNLSEVASFGGNIEFQAPVMVDGDVAYIHNYQGSGSIVFHKAVDGGSSASHLEVDAGMGEIRLSANVGENAALGNINFSAAKLNLPAKMITKGGKIDISAATFMNQDVSIDTTAAGACSGGSLNFKGEKSTIDGNYLFFADAGSGQTSFEGVVGGLVAPHRFHVKAGNTLLSKDVSASGGTIIYETAVTVSGTPVFTDYGPTGIAFLSTLDATSANTDSLTLNAAMGRVLFAGAVGGITSLEQLTVTSNTLEQMSTVVVASNAVTGALVYTAPAGVTVAGDITATGSGGQNGTITINNPT
ncbi:MAG: filamentous hemagglutinin N-terminal domain-containing protein, partial [Chlamydiales bacterium]|nr:filamentous hemagglutinin N-terminal domain-containing protein [Chlamydiales bacterium]